MNEKNGIDINFSALFDNILRRLWLILLCAVVAAGAAYAYVSFFVTPVYSSTATLYVGKEPSNLSDTNLYETLAKDFEVIIKQRTVLDEVVKRLGLKTNAAALRGSMSVTNIADTRILNITVSTSDPVLSKNIADTVCSVASERFVEIVKVDYVSIVDTGSLSTTPSNISFVRTMVLAAFAGALVCAFVIVVRTLMDDKIKTPEDVEFYLGMSVLGTTPFTKNVDSDNQRSGSPFKKKRRGTHHGK